MKTSYKIWISIGFFLVSMAIGSIIYDTTYLQKITPKIYHIESLLNTKDEVLVSINLSYSAILGDDLYKEQKMWIKLLYTEVTHEILCDFYLEDYLQKTDEIFYAINKAFITKVVQRFPDIEFQIIDMEIIIKL